MNSHRIEKRAWPVLAAVTLALAGTAGLGCASTRAAPAKESTGEYVDNTVITTKVKAALLEEPGLKSFQIGVKTFKDTVQLSGFVDSHQAAALAERVAKGVAGVTSVRNDLIVK
jgi:osmotically-inducible protein OsmY